MTDIHKAAEEGKLTRTETPMSSDAEREAERINKWADEQFSRGVESAQGVDVDSFVAGAEWMRERAAQIISVESLRGRLADAIRKIGENDA